MGESASEFLRTLDDLLDVWRIKRTAVQLEKLHQHFNAVVEANARINLTRITDPIEAAVKHYADSLSLLLWTRERNAPVGTVIDVGTGAGFPAFPLAVMCPDWNVIAIDGTAKKVAFVERVCRELGVENLQAIHAHSTHWPASPTADVVVVRAVARLSKCVKDAGSLVGAGGHLVAYKTRLSNDDAELIGAQEQCTDSQLGMDQPVLYELRLGGEPLPRALYPMPRLGT